MLGSLRDYSHDHDGTDALTNGLGLTQNLAPCVKYVVKGSRGSNQLQDLQIARWYLNNEIKRLTELEDHKLAQPMMETAGER